MTRINSKQNITLELIHTYCKDFDFQYFSNQDGKHAVVTYFGSELCYCELCSHNFHTCSKGHDRVLILINGHVLLHFKILDEEALDNK